MFPGRMEPGQQVAIWLHDQAAKLFLGLPDRHPVSRWLVYGTVLPIQTPIGVWLDVKFVEERRAGGKQKDIHYGGKRIHYNVGPAPCLIRWDYVITAQNVKEIPKDTRPAPGLYL